MSDFLSQLTDTAKGIAPKLLGGLLSTIPVVGGLAGGVAEVALGEVLGTMKESPEETDEKVAQRILQDPNLYLQFKTKLQDKEIALAKEETKKHENYTKVLQTDVISEDKFTKRWRPFNGYLFGITLFSDYFLSQVILSFCHGYFEKFVYSWSHIPQGVYMMWTIVLGVAAGSRGVEKVEKMKKSGIQMDLGETVKQALKGVVGK